MYNKILFSQLLEENRPLILEHMRWENYGLNEVQIEATEQVKNDALMLLERNYGKTSIYDDMLDDFLVDVFVNFPVLLQQLAITRLIDGHGVVKDDVNTIETIRNEEISTKLDQNSIASQTGTQNDATTLNTQNKTTGTVSTDDDSTNVQTSSTSIENIAGTEQTGMRNVNLSHNLPEQALTGTGNFSSDEQGTPILTNSYIQQANEGFTTSNPINSKETSQQTINNSNETLSNNVTTNDISVSNTGTNTRVLSTNNADNAELSSESSGNNKITETITSTSTNKQYAYEIKAFLETAQSTIAFRNWINQFSWIEGII